MIPQITFSWEITLGAAALFVTVLGGLATVLWAASRWVAGIDRDLKQLMGLVSGNGTISLLAERVRLLEHDISNLMNRLQMKDRVEGMRARAGLPRSITPEPGERP